MKSVFIYTMIMAACFLLKFRKQSALKGEDLCGDHRAGMVNIRFENSSRYDFRNIRIFKNGGALILADLDSGERSCFKSFEERTLLTDMELKIRGETYYLDPAVFHSNKDEGLAQGYYNCRIDVTGTESNRLILELDRL